MCLCDGVFVCLWVCVLVCRVFVLACVFVRLCGCVFVCLRDLYAFVRGVDCVLVKSRVVACLCSCMCMFVCLCACVLVCLCLRVLVCLCVLHTSVFV